MNKHHIAYAQRRLGIPQDGVIGPLTVAAAKTHVLQDHHYRESWKWPRIVTAFIQDQAAGRGLDPGPVDGWWGPQTEEAWANLMLLDAGHQPDLWRDDIARTERHWPRDTEQALTDYYGPVGDGLVRIAAPYPLRIAWNPKQTVARIHCHALVAGSLTDVLSNVLDAYGLEEIRRLRLDQYGGCYNKRRMRGGSRWSTHARGIALDWDPACNQLRWGRDKARFARPEYARWWDCWTAQGWTSLGMAKNYDWMHVQAARV